MKSINLSEFDYCNVNINNSWWIQCQIYEKSHKMVGGPVLLMMMMSYNGWRYFPLALSPVLSSSITCCNCRSNPQNKLSSSRRMQQSRKVIISISHAKGTKLHSTALSKTGHSRFVLLLQVNKQYFMSCKCRNKTMITMCVRVSIHTKT